LPFPNHPDSHFRRVGEDPTRAGYRVRSEGVAADDHGSDNTAALLLSSDHLFAQLYVKASTLDQDPEQDSANVPPRISVSDSVKRKRAEQGQQVIRTFACPYVWAMLLLVSIGGWLI
jgi:hypothetical protein